MYVCVCIVCVCVCVLSYCSQVQDGFVPPFTVLLLVLVAELCCSALYELEGLQHGGRVGHVGFTGGKQERNEVRLCQ